MTALPGMLRPILEQIGKLWAKVDQMSTIRYGVVATTAPLTVALDGSIDDNGNPVLAPAQSLLEGLTTGTRVLCVEQHRRVIIFQAAGQQYTPAP